MMNLPSKHLTALIAAASALAFVTGCSSATDEATAEPSAQASEAAPSGGPGGQPGGAAMPGTFGLIAEVQGTTLQVQGDDGQTAVTYTDDTTFTRQATGTAADVVAGVCVTATGGDSEDTGSAADQVSVSSPVDGECEGGFGGQGDGQPPTQGDTPPSAMASGQPGEAPSGAPSDMPSGAPSDGGGFEGGGLQGTRVSGLVESVDGDTVTVTGQDDTTSTFTIGSETIVTTTVEASSADAVAGLCASAQGDTDDTGAVTATSIRLSEATDGECTRGGQR